VAAKAFVPFVEQVIAVHGTAATLLLVHATPALVEVYIRPAAVATKKRVPFADEATPVILRDDAIVELFHGTLWTSQAVPELVEV
jgi:hypothetical protein